MSKETFELFLMEKHAEDYIGTKDCMVDDFNEWITTEDMDTIIKLGDEFAKKQSKGLLKACKEISEGKGRYSEDPFQHARNTIEDMKAIAKQAITKATNNT